MKLALGSLVLALLALAPAASAADTFEVDASHSVVGFGITHLKVSRFYGRFNDVSGKIVVDADPAKCSVEIKVKAASVDTANGNRDKHLRSQDFFSVEEFPDITFKSTSVKKTEKGWDVTGTFTLHGVSKEITVPVEHLGTGQHPRGGTLAGFEAVFTIKRSDYGMTYGLPDALGDEVKLHIAIEAAKK